VCAVALVTLAAPFSASAQTAFADDDRAGLVSAGALAGAMLDTSDDWLIFGADARVQIQHGLEVEPRFTYQPLTNGHVIQLDANVLKNLDLARPGRFRPFFGVGGTLTSYSPDRGDGDTKVGLNLISGTRIAMSSGSGYEPFIVAEYSIVREQANGFSITVGASFKLRH
jgi:hypothetical protein